MILATPPASVEMLDDQGEPVKGGASLWVTLEGSR